MTAGLKTRNCRWIDVRGAVDERGRINFLEAGKDLPFQPRRLFWRYLTTNPRALYLLLNRSRPADSSRGPQR